MHPEDCTSHETCLVSKEKKQENHLTRDAQKVNMPDHFMCTVTCGCCGKRHIYGDESHKKNRISEELLEKQKNQVELLLELYVGNPWEDWPSVLAAWTFGFL